MTRLRQELLVGPTLLITLILCIVGREMLEVDSQGVDDSPFFGDLRSSAGVEMGCAAKMASNGFTVRVSMGILFSDKATRIRRFSKCGKMCCVHFSFTYTYYTRMCIYTYIHIE